MIGPSGTTRAQYDGPTRPLQNALAFTPYFTEGGAQFHPVSFIVAPGSWRVRENSPLWAYGKQSTYCAKSQAGAPLINWYNPSGHNALPRQNARGPVRL